jgi:hypothetical protein
MSKNYLRSRSSRSVWVLLGGMLLLFTPATQAQSVQSQAPPPQFAQPQPTSLPAVPVPTSCMADADCRAYVNVARGLSESNQPEGALAAYQKANERIPTPRLLTSIGRLQQRLGRLRQAAESYHQYLSSDAAKQDAEARARVEGWLAEVEAELAKPVPPPPAPPPKPLPTPLYRRWWIWTIAGVVVAGGVAGITAAVVTHRSVPSDAPTFMPFAP